MNFDDLKDLHTHMSGNFGTVAIAAGPNVQGHRMADDLDSVVELPPYERQSIVIIGNKEAKAELQAVNFPAVRIFLNFNDASFVQFDNAVVASRDEGRHVLAALLALQQTVVRRAPARLFERLIKTTFIATILGVFIWACVSLASLRNVPLLIVLGLAVGYMAATASQTQSVRVALARFTRSRDRLIFDNISRVEFETERRNRHADTKAGLVGVLIGAAIAVMGMVIVRSIFR